jgi:hypothetical protein
MGSVSELQGMDLCDSCLQPQETLFNHDGDRLCERCRAVFWTAAVLFDYEITDEAEIVPTIAFAARMGELENLNDAERCREFVQEFAQKYRRFELTEVVDGVPVLRLRPVVIDVVRYVGSTLPRKLQIEILSRFADADKVAELYEQTLAEENIHFDACTGGNITWNAEEAHLSILVGAKRELHPSRVGYYSAYPKGRIYSFPPPNLIRGLYVALLGSTDKRTFAGYAYGLGDHERPKTKTAEKAIPACVAWYIGERDETIKPIERRPRVAQILNRHLLRPLGKAELPEDHWRNDDPIWRDAREVSQRLMRAEYFLQRLEF